MIHQHHLSVITHQITSGARYRDAFVKQVQLQLPQVITISTVFLAFLMPLTKRSTPSPGWISSFTMFLASLAPCFDAEQFSAASQKHNRPCASRHPSRMKPKNGCRALKK
ncbi:MAG: hypothetical protein DMG74_18000 [Acidobacteria bacterium]|nr:MAG: hypothetical protein DMG74_18000 [Acidobacteriota bacterium]